ncbi:hypothetical protein KJ359_007019 [Pestalotiopsis sp. 9143b]|nr:hypothetical protein KJ359_007019 [Pestalotiopsis sp. 9143b]
MAATAPDSADWETLPTEISLSILKQLPDLTTLYSYITSSPAAARVFDTYAAEIVESHLVSGAVHAYTGAIIRLAAYVRSGVRPPGVSDFDDFNNLYVHETTEHRYEPPQWTEEPLRLTQQQSGANGTQAGISASVLRSVLASHRRNERLMAGCLAMYLPRFRALQPQWVADREFTFESVYHGPDHTDFVGAWQMQPATVPVPKRDLGPPTWCEEQRLLRAAWRIQLYEDMKTAAIAGRFLDHWPENVLRKLRRDDPTLLMWVELDCLIAVHDYELDIHHQLIDVEDELINTVLDYIDSMKEKIGPSFSLANDALLLHIPDRDWPVPTPSPRDILEVEWYTSAMNLEFQAVHGSEMDHVTEDACTPLQHVPWDFYRRRGFAIWCEKRLLGYGLIPPGSCFKIGEHPVAAIAPDENYSTSMLFMAWKSVLVEQELAEVDRVNQIRQEECMRPPPVTLTGIISCLERNVTPDIYRVAPKDTE